MEIRVITPNFARLADHSVTFDCFHSGSLPWQSLQERITYWRYNFYTELGDQWNPLMNQCHKCFVIMAYIHLMDPLSLLGRWGATYHNRFAKSKSKIKGQERDP